MVSQLRDQPVAHHRHYDSGSLLLACHPVHHRAGRINEWTFQRTKYGHASRMWAEFNCPFPPQGEVFDAYAETSASQEGL